MSSCHKAAKAAAGGEDEYEDVSDLRTEDDVELKTFCEEFVREEACCREAGGEEDINAVEEEADYDLRGVNDYEDIIGLRTDDGPGDYDTRGAVPATTGEYPHM